MGVISIVTGLAGALTTAIPWIYQIEPGSRIMGSYSSELRPAGCLSQPS